MKTILHQISGEPHFLSNTPLYGLIGNQSSVHVFGKPLLWPVTLTQHNLLLLVTIG